MNAQPPIEWKLSLRAPPGRVYERWTTDKGRASFWAERSRPIAGGFELCFVNGVTLAVPVIEARSPDLFSFGYFGGSTVSLDFEPDGRGGCDLRLTETGLRTPEDREENRAGWVSVLLALKAAVDFRLDIRSHDPSRTWDQGFVDC